MKKFTRWLAKVTGVTAEIRQEAYKKAGGEMQQYAHWFTGGLMVEGHKYDISNILYEYPRRCLNHGTPHMFGSQFADLRAELWKLSEEDKSIIMEENKRHGV